MNEKKQQLQDRNEQQQNAAATSKIKIITSLFLSHYVNMELLLLFYGNLLILKIVSVVKYLSKLRN